MEITGGGGKNTGRRSGGGKSLSRWAAAGFCAVLTLGCATTTAPGAQSSGPAPQSAVPDVTISTDPATVSATPKPGAVKRPKIVQHPIPFGPKRKRQMARYSQMHYGDRSWQLDPKGIVEHYTATNSLQSVFATFASNAPDPELGQKPGTCAHFVVDRDGTIYQLVPLDIRCRHTVGLNDRMIGVENVGMSDGAVMHNPAQRKASLKLALWLMAQYGFSVGDVIGHNESVSSRYHHELYGPWRCQTHGDMSRSTMNQFRRLLARKAQAAGLDTTGPQWRSSGC